MNEKEIKYIDLFGGIGGFRLGIERAENNREQESIRQRTIGEHIQHEGNIRNSDGRWGESEQKEGYRLFNGLHFNCVASEGIERAENLGRIQQGIPERAEGKSTQNKRKLLNGREFNCVAYYDNDKYSVQTYNKNFGENHEPTDITTVRTEDIPDHDLLCAGFPCQAFSIAGKRRGFKDTRGTMFFEIARIVKAKRPSYLLLENVKGLLNHEKGKTFSTILQTLAELGYEVQWLVLNSKFFGVPQNRERVFIIGNLRGTTRPEILPFGEISSEDNKGLEGQIHPTLTEAIGRGGRSKEYLTSLKMIHNIYGGFKEGVREYNTTSPTIRTPKGGGHLPMVMALKSATKQGYSEACVGDGVRLEYPNSKTARGRVVKGASNTLKRGTEGVIDNTAQIRRLTPTECERLQGFPDGWTEGVSDTQRYKQLGNAVTVNVIEAIIEAYL